MNKHFSYPLTMFSRISPVDNVKRKLYMLPIGIQKPRLCASSAGDCLKKITRAIFFFKNLFYKLVYFRILLLMFNPFSDIRTIKLLVCPTRVFVGRIQISPNAAEKYNSLNASEAESAISQSHKKRYRF